MSTAAAQSTPIFVWISTNIYYPWVDVVFRPLERYRADNCLHLSCSYSDLERAYWSTDLSVERRLICVTFGKWQGWPFVAYAEECLPNFHCFHLWAYSFVTKLLWPPWSCSSNLVASQKCHSTELCPWNLATSTWQHLCPLIQLSCYFAHPWAYF